MGCRTAVRAETLRPGCHRDAALQMAAHLLMWPEDFTCSLLMEVTLGRIHVYNNLLVNQTDG